MTPRMSIIGASLKRLLQNVSNYLDLLWSDVSLAIHADGSADKGDPYWGFVSLAMPMSSSLDDLKGHTKTVYGTSRVSSPALFNGSSLYNLASSNNYILFDNHKDFLFGLLNFTVEFWLYAPSTVTVSQSIIGVYGLTGSSWHVGVGVSNKLFYEVTTDGSYQVANSILAGVDSATIGRWQHIAFVRNGNNFTLYSNGISAVSHTLASALHDATIPLYIGIVHDGSQKFTGYLQDIRITKGFARYTGAFNPPTNPLSFKAPSIYDPEAHNVVLAMHMDGLNNGVVFTDSLEKAVTVNGTVVTSTTQKKFGTTSAYFDGAVDSYLRLGDNADWDFGVDFTIEFWLYPIGIGATAGKAILDFRPDSTNGAYITVIYGLGNDSKITLYANTATQLVSLNTLTTSSWNHVTINRLGSIVFMFVNGAYQGHVTLTTSFIADQLLIGGSSFRSAQPTSFLNGYIDDLRITKGACRKTAKYTLETSTFIDPIYDLKNHIITRTGDAKQSASQSKYGGWGLYYDGTTDGHIFEAGAEFDFSTAPFTIEFFAYINANSDLNSGSVRTATILSANYPTSGSISNAWAVEILGDASTTGTGIRFVAYVGTTQRIVSATVSISQSAWHHIAIVRNSGIVEIFLDGSKLTTSTNTLSKAEAVSNGATYKSRISGTTYSGYPQIFNGFIDDLRVTKDSRYTINFAISANTFSDNVLDVDPYVSNVTTHIPMDGHNGDKYWDCVALAIPVDGFNTNTSFYDYKGQTLTPVADVRVSTAVEHFNSPTIYFDGVDDRILLGSSVPANLQLGSVDFTIEFWIYPLGTGEYSVIGNLQNNSGAGHYWIIINSTYLGLHTVQFGGNGGTFRFGTSTLAINSWSHIAISRSGTSIRCFLNGSQLGTTGTLNDFSGTMSIEYLIGASVNVPGVSYSYGMYGYLDDIRITRGISRYNANFNIPTKSFTGFIDKKDSIVKVGGQLRLTTEAYKYGSWSGKFIGNQHYFTLDGSSKYSFGTADFTIEFWIHFTSVTNSKIIDFRNLTSSGAFPTIDIVSGTVGYYVNGSYRITSGSALSTGNWYHIAISRCSGITKLFINGAISGTPWTDSTNYSIETDRPIVGGNGVFGSIGNEGLQGYMQDLRITKACRYLTKFTVPDRMLPYV